MTVGELIEELSRFRHDLPVEVIAEDGEDTAKAVTFYYVATTGQATSVVVSGRECDANTADCPGPGCDLSVEHPHDRGHQPVTGLYPEVPA